MSVTDEGYGYWCAGHDLPAHWQVEQLVDCLGKLLEHIYDGHHGRMVQVTIDNRCVRHLAMAFKMGELARKTAHL